MRNRTAHVGRIGPPDPDADPVAPPADQPPILTQADRLEACEDRFADELRRLRESVLSALAPNKARHLIEPGILERIACVERATRDLARESERAGFLAAAGALGVDPARALVDLETRRDREGGR